MERNMKLRSILLAAAAATIATTLASPAVFAQAGKTPADVNSTRSDPAAPTYPSPNPMGDSKNSRSGTSGAGASGDGGGGAGGGGGGAGGGGGSGSGG